MAKRRVYYNGGLFKDERKDSSGNPMPRIVRVVGRPVAIPHVGGYLELRDLEAQELMRKYPSDPQGRQPFTYQPQRYDHIPVTPPRKAPELSNTELLAELEKRPELLKALKIDQSVPEKNEKSDSDTEKKSPGRPRKEDSK